MAAVINGEQPLPVRRHLDLNLDPYIFLDRGEPRVVPEADLRALTQGPLKRLIQKPENYEKSLCLWKCLYYTLKDTLLPIPHQASVCNAVCAFLEASLTAVGSEICQFARSEAIWLSLFNLYLERFEYSPPKPLKQILATLTSILATHSDPDTASSIRSYLIKSVVQTILLAEPLTRLKAAIVSLQFLIRKDAFPATELITRLEAWLCSNLHRWTPVVGEHCINAGLDLSPFSNSDQDGRLNIERARSPITAQVFCLVLLLHLQNPNLVTSSGALLAQICFRLKLESERGNFQHSLADGGAPFWTGPLKYLSLRNLDNLDSTMSLAFHLLFRGRPAEFQSFLHVLPLQDLISERYADTCAAEFGLLIAVLETGKELGLVHDDKPSSSYPDGNFLVLETRKISPLLIHPNPKIRIPALSLLISAPSTTKLFSSEVLLLFKETLPFIHAEADAHVRSEIVSLIRRLTIRLRGSSSSRKIAAKDNTLENSPYPTDIKEFLSWYISFLESELRPSASYQTHILALKALAIIIQSGLDPRIDPTKLSKVGNDQKSWSFSIDIFTTTLFRPLGDLLVNPYEEIRATSLTILGLFPATYLKADPSNGSHPDAHNFIISSPYDQLVQALSRAEEMATRTSRADHADGLARIYHLLFDMAANGRNHKGDTDSFDYKYEIVDMLLAKLEKVTALSDVVALRNTPIHGYLSALRYIMGTPNFYLFISNETDSQQAWKLAFDRVLRLCEAMWIDVQAVLCVDSPEREHENSSEDLLGPKDILSCSWRALRESSLLLNSILMNVSFAPHGGENGLGFEEFARIGSLTFSQLAELRHRGAFSAVSQTFASCCLRCSSSKDISISGLPATWLREILDTIHSQSSKLTRRSAGLPALALGVASSAKPTFFHTIMENLQDIAKVTPSCGSEQSDMKLPQVHAMNCLKDIFTATNLAAITEGYLMPALSISAECLGSEIWAIRNCGLMLFRSLVQRMCRRTNGVSHGFGLSTDPEPKHLIPFQRFPGLIPLLTGLLEKGAPDIASSQDESLSSTLSVITERVFPALELIGNKIPSPSSADDQRILESVAKQFESPAWGIRDHAARTYAALIEREDILTVVSSLCEGRSLKMNQNLLHGKTLCIRYLLQRIWASPKAYYREILPSAVSTTIDVLKLKSDAISPFTLRELVEIVNDTLQSSIMQGTSGLIISHFDAMSDILDYDGVFNNISSHPNSNSSIARSSSLLLEGIAFSRLLTGILLRNSPSDLADFIRTVSDIDVDIAPSIMKRLNQAFVDHIPFLDDWFKFHSQVIDLAPSKRLKLVAISNLSTDLEKILESSENGLEDRDQGFLSSIHSKLPSSVSLVSERTEEALWSRDMVDACLRLQGCLLSLKIKGSAAILNTDPFVTEQFNRLVKQLSFSICEDTVFTSRYAAAMSLRTVFSSLSTSCDSFSKTPALVDALFVLYDLLNDDDVELRELATSIASQVLKDQSTSFRLPAAAAHGIAEFLTKHYGTSARVFEGSLARLLGSSTKRALVPASDILNKALKESTVLFAEEKQNLYIDDTREAKLWADKMVKLTDIAIDARLYKQFVSWVNDGLDSLLKISASYPNDSVLGWTSNVDVSVTGFRILYGAKVILLSSGSSCVGVDTTTLLSKLTTLLSDMLQRQINPPWIKLLEELLILRTSF